MSSPTIFNSERQQNLPTSSDSTRATDTPDLIPVAEKEIEYRELASLWPSIPPKVQKRLWNSDPLVPPIINSLRWMQHHTRTMDPQSLNQSYRPFPPRPYFKVLHKVWIKEPVMFVEKSRTMMCSWWSAAEALHWVMTRQPAKAIFWAMDEARSLTLLQYAKCLYGQQDAIFKTIFPVLRPLERQSYNQLELKDGGILIALPGKDPDRIRSEHPTIVIVDEAAFMENGGESFDVALSSRVPKMMCISSAAPGWFYQITKDARTIPLEEYL